MPQETKNIIQLKESTSGPNFYPETHKAAIVGKEDYTYLGQVVSPGGGGGGSTGTKGLSVSPRQSVIAGKCIPPHPRKGKKYYFGDGVIKVKEEERLEDSSGNWYREIKYYIAVRSIVTPVSVMNSRPCSNKVPSQVYNRLQRYERHPVLVTITQECPNETFDLSTMARVSFVGGFTSETESPFIFIENGHIVVRGEPIKEKVSLGADIQQIAEQRARVVITDYERNTCDDFRQNKYTYKFNGKLVAYYITLRWGQGRTGNPPISGKFPMRTYRRVWVTNDMKYRPLRFYNLIIWWRKCGRCDYPVYVHSVRRGRISKDCFKGHSSMSVIAYGYDNYSDAMVPIRLPFILDWMREFQW